jgi:hypothetical protein
MRTGPGAGGGARSASRASYPALLRLGASLPRAKFSKIAGSGDLPRGFLAAGHAAMPNCNGRLVGSAFRDFFRGGFFFLGWAGRLASVPGNLAGISGALDSGVSGFLSLGGRLLFSAGLEFLLAPFCRVRPA